MVSVVALDLNGRTFSPVTKARETQLRTILHVLGFKLGITGGTLLTTPVSSRRGSPQAKANLADALKACSSASCLLVDLGQNLGHLCDDPFLILLTELLEAEADRFDTYVLLLPFKLFATDPSKPDYDSTLRFQKTSCRKLIVIDSHLSGREYPKGNAIEAIAKKDLPGQIKSTLGRPEDEIRHRLVRRVGHFKAPLENCRNSSYALHSGDSVLRRLLTERLSDIPLKTVVYDARKNPWMRTAIAAFCTDRNVHQIPIQNLDMSLRSGVRLEEHVLLLLDVMCTGDTASRWIDDVQSHLMAPESFSVKAVFGNRQTLVVNRKSLEINPFVELPVTVQPREKCEQCQLGLPYQDEKTAENAVTLREYDFWNLLTSVPWRDEVEPPLDVGTAYDQVPNYEMILEETGGWLAYLMANRLRQVHGYWALVHPEQRESSALCAMIRGELQDLDVPIIAIPDEIISQVRTGDKEWRARVDQSNELWRKNLHLLRSTGGGAVVIDIFSGSGATFKAVQQILQATEVPVHLWFPMIERNPDAAARSGVTHDALYTWWGPRKLRRQ